MGVAVLWALLGGFELTATHLILAREAVARPVLLAVLSLNHVDPHPKPETDRVPRPLVARDYRKLVLFVRPLRR